MVLGSWVEVPDSIPETLIARSCTESSVRATELEASPFGNDPIGRHFFTRPLDRTPDSHQSMCSGTDQPTIIARSHSCRKGKSHEYLQSMASQGKIRARDLG